MSCILIENHIENHSRILVKHHSGETICIKADSMDVDDGLLIAWLDKALVFVTKIDNVEYACISKQGDE